MTIARLHNAPESCYRFFGPKYRCAYCGEPADTIDHTTPRWFVQANPALTDRYLLVKVSACMQCNLFAAGNVDTTWSARKIRIAKKLFARGKRLLATAHWPKEELDELGYGLRCTIEKAQIDADVLRRRIAILRETWWPYDIPQNLQIKKTDEDFVVDDA